MGHGKLRKFAENETFRCLLQPEASSVLVGGTRELVLRDHPIKGNWRSMFAFEQPIVLELGCGKGDYTIALAERHPEMNFIGVDIKGARLWTGAKYATEHGLTNVAFLRPRRGLRGLADLFRSAVPQREFAPLLAALPGALPLLPEARRHRPPQNGLPLPPRIHNVRDSREWAGSPQIIDRYI